MDCAEGCVFSYFQMALVLKSLGLDSKVFRKVSEECDSILQRNSFQKVVPANISSLSFPVPIFTKKSFWTPLIVLVILYVEEKPAPP